MKIPDIAKVRVNWMEGFANDPHLEFILKRDREMLSIDAFEFHQHGDVFWAERDNEVDFMAHNRSDHNGFAGRIFKLHMAANWDASKWRDCERREPYWGSGGQSVDVRCHFDPETRVLSLKGPWCVGPPRLHGVCECMDVSTMSAKWRNSIKMPNIYQRQKRQQALHGGHVYEGLFCQAFYTVDFVREAVDRLLPSCELWEGDYGWTVKRRDMPPKNERRLAEPYSHQFMSAEQSAAVFHA